MIIWVRLSEQEFSGVHIGCFSLAVKCKRALLLQTKSDAVRLAMDKPQIGLLRLYGRKEIQS